MQAKSRGGTGYTFERGDALRVFRFQHRGLSGDDWALYERVVEETQEGNGQLFYEHPGSGDAFEVLDDCSDPSRWTATGTLASAPEWRTPPGALRWTSADATAHTMQQVFAARDLRGKMLRVTVRPFGDLAWIVNPSSLDFRVGSAVDHESRYNLAATIIGDVSPSRYWVFYVDLDEVAQAQGAYGPADLAEADRISFGWAPTLASQQIDIDQIAVIDKSMQPTLCEITRYTAVQDSPAPSGPAGPTYTVTMELQEVFV